MTNSDSDAWFLFTIRDTGSAGVEIPQLVRLLGDISTAFYTIAREKMGVDVSKRGPRSAAEDMLASVRVKRVEPGSTILELSPPEEATQASLSFAVNADDIAVAFVQEFKTIADSATSRSSSLVRRRVRRVIRDAAEVGSIAEVVVNPRSMRPEYEVEGALVASIRTRELVEETTENTVRRTRKIAGHAFMVDVEPGRQRIRVKLPQGQDVTLELEESLSSERIREALDHPVEVDVEEEFVGNVGGKRIATAVSILGSASETSGAPPKSIVALMLEQNLPAARPDYAELASQIWSTEDEVQAFNEYLSDSRERNAG